MLVPYSYLIIAIAMVCFSACLPSCITWWQVIYQGFHKDLCLILVIDFLTQGQHYMLVPSDVEFSFGNKKNAFAFLSFLNTEMTHAVENIS